MKNNFIHIMKTSKDKKYVFLKKRSYDYKNYQIIPLRYDDIIKIKEWRNEQITILRQQEPISEAEQLEYYENKIKKSFIDTRPEQILFSFLLNGNCIGYGGLVHIDWEKKQAELSFLNETKRSLNEKIFYEDFNSFLHLIFRIIFSELLFEKVLTEVYDTRQNLITILQEARFIFVKKLDNSVIIDGIQHDSLLHVFYKKSYMDFLKKVKLNED